jgi:predicted ribosomally synthesized peptide with SipW-like signal peptide
MTKQKSTKRALLMSALALLMCVSMLIGSTFAWFTDTASTAVNTIQSGTLDVVLEKFDEAKGEWVPAEGETLKWITTDAVDNVLWEPGCTYKLPLLRVRNAGNLALKYDVVITGIQGDAKLLEVINFSGMPVNTHLLAGESKEFQIEGHMAEEAGNEYQDLKIENIAITVYATQYNYESDSYGPDYDKFAQPVVVYTADELAAELTSDKEIISVILGKDINVPMGSLGTQTGGSGEYKLGGEDTKAIIINLGGNKLNITTTYMSSIGAKNADAIFTIKNGTMNSTGNSAKTWNINDLTFANCNYVIENVVFEKEVAFTNTGKDATLKNVTINGTGDYYALWISARGQKVTIDGLTINTVGRGIKIDEQYVDAPAKVTLKVSNATFNTTKKAAIIVKSAAGADVTLNNVDISAVANDPFNAVWVDEDAKAYADLVTVNGGSKIVEGSTEAPKSTSVAANTTVSIGSVMTAGGQTVVNNAGTITLSGRPSLGSGDIVINGGTVNYGTSGGFNKGLIDGNTEIYNNATIVGSVSLYGKKVIFNNCTFDLTGISDYIWTYGAKEVEFNNCTFNTKGKAILVYNEGYVGSSVVTVNGCTFNASASAYASAVPGQPCAAVEIDSSLIPGTYTLNFVGENVVDSDFSGLVRIKNDGGKNNVTINGATPVTLP